jgi:hypothetical protein
MSKHLCIDTLLRTIEQAREKANSPASLYQQQQTPQQTVMPNFMPRQQLMLQQTLQQQTISQQPQLQQELSHQTFANTSAMIQSELVAIAQSQANIRELLGRSTQPALYPSNVQPDTFATIPSLGTSNHSVPQLFTLFQNQLYSQGR